MFNTPLEMTPRSTDVDNSPSSAQLVDDNKPESVENTNDSLQDLKSASVEMGKQKLSKKQKRRQAGNASKSSIPTESKAALTEQTTSVEADTSTELVVQSIQPLNFNHLRKRSRKYMTITDGHKMASNDEYFLVCPKNRLCLLNAQGKEHLSIKREFDVNDVCWSTYLK